MACSHVFVSLSERPVALLRPFAVDAGDSEAAARGDFGTQTGDVLEFAKYLGMDIEADKSLLWIAAQALNANLPPSWTEHEECVSDNFQLTGRLS